MRTKTSTEGLTRIPSLQDNDGETPGSDISDILELIAKVLVDEDLSRVTNKADKGKSIEQGRDQTH